MNTKDYLLFLNVAGSVCSILALMLTLSQNITFALCVEALIAVAFFIATAGTLGAWTLVLFMILKLVIIETIVGNLPDVKILIR